MRAPHTQDNFLVASACRSYVRNELRAAGLPCIPRNCLAYSPLQVAVVRLATTLLRVLQSSLSFPLGFKLIQLLFLFARVVVYG